jgi:hypothetical protein
MWTPTEDDINDVRTPLNPGRVIEECVEGAFDVC